MSVMEGTRPDLQALLHQAQALIERQRYSTARQLLAGMMQEHPDHPQVLYLCAFVDYSEDRLDAAERTVNTVLEKAPTHYGARTLRGHLYESQKRFPEAEAVWIDLLHDYPESADCYADYADLMLRMLHLTKAERLAQEGLRLAPSHEKCLYVAALIHLVQGGSRRKNSVHLNQLLHEHPERARALIALVISLEERGDSRGALRVARQLLSMRPDSEPLVNLVKALTRNNHWSMLPLYPVRRWGWGGAAAITALGITAVRIAGNTLPPLAAVLIVLVWVAYVLYSWIWPAILKKLIS